MIDILNTLLNLPAWVLICTFVFYVWPACWCSVDIFKEHIKNYKYDKDAIEAGDEPFRLTLGSIMISLIPVFVPVINFACYVSDILPDNSHFLNKIFNTSLVRKRK